MEKQFENALAAESEKDGVELPNVFRDSSWGTLSNTTHFQTR